MATEIVLMMLPSQTMRLQRIMEQIAVPWLVTKGAYLMQILLSTRAQMADSSSIGTSKKAPVHICGLCVGQVGGCRGYFATLIRREVGWRVCCTVFNNEQNQQWGRKKALDLAVAVGYD